MIRFYNIRKNNRLLFLSLLFAVGISLLHTVFRLHYVHNLNDIIFTPYTSWLGIDVFSLFNLLFYFSLPLFASLGLPTAIKADLDSGFIQHIRMHIPLKKYMLGSVIASFLSGFMIVFIALLLSVFAAFALLPNIMPDDLINRNISILGDTTLFVSMYYTHPFVHMLFYVFFGSLFGGIFSVLSLVASLNIKNKIMGILTPFVLQIILFIANSVFVIKAITPFMFLPETTPIKPIDITHTLFTLGGIIVLIIILFFMGIRKYED